MLMMKLPLLPLLSLCISATLMPSNAQTFSSGAGQVALLELYTSEGCSSCPPAESWLSKLNGQAGLWKQFIPVAFHVTYWDNLGWKDAAGNNAFNERERAIAAAWGTGTIYTPCFVLDGREWRASESNLASSLGPRKMPGDLRITRQDKSVVVVFDPANAATDSLKATVVVLGSGIKTKVRRGENAGRELAHDFVVLSHQTAVLKQKPDGNYEVTVTLADPAISAPRLALAAWIEMEGSPQPIQATGGWLN